MTDQTALAVQEQREPSVLQIIATLARDPSTDVEKFAQLLALKERMEAKEAEMAFNRDFMALSAEIPHIRQDGKIELKSGAVIKFQRYETLDSVLKPLEQKYGFTRSFVSEPVAGGVIVCCRLAHKGGHSITSKKQAPPDTGPNRNSLQALGSSDSYCRRYLTTGLYNIVSMGADDDGNTATPLTQEEADEIYRLMDAANLKPERRKQFLTDIAGGAATVELIQRGKYDDCVARLQDRVRNANRT